MSDIKAYPVSEDQLKLFKDLGKVHSEYNTVGGVRLYKIVQGEHVDDFYIYVSPKLKPSNFTSIIKTPLKNE